MNKIVNVKMYYDEYEKYFGDGFYPFLTEKENKTGITQITFSFYYKEKCWIQVNQDEINGLDGDTGKHLLDYLNREENEKGKTIKNNYGFILYREA